MLVSIGREYRQYITELGGTVFLRREALAVPVHVFRARVDFSELRIAQPQNPQKIASNPNFDDVGLRRRNLTSTNLRNGCRTYFLEFSSGLLVAIFTSAPRTNTANTISPKSWLITI